MTYIETTTLGKTVFRSTVWKSYIHDIFSLWDMSKPDIEAFIEQVNLHHPTIEFTAETFDTETAFLDTVVYKGRDSRKNLYLMQRHKKTHQKPPLMDGGYPQSFKENLLSEIKFTEGSLNCYNKTTGRKKKHCHS